MLFLGVVMMPFYYGSKVRSVPEFMRRRFGTGAHLVNAISFAVPQVLIAGINLYLLATIVGSLLGWPLGSPCGRGSAPSSSRRPRTDRAQRVGATSRTLDYVA
jgi:Na+/proline symporter